MCEETETSVTGPSAETTTMLAEKPADAAHPPQVSAVLADAAEQARAAVEEFSGAQTVGDYVGVDYEDPTAATHRFLAQLPGYQGWQWAVVVAAWPGADHATISEAVLIPGSTALLAPDWVPWEQRVRPGDLSPGDLLAPAPSDPRLVPGYTSSGDTDVDEVAAELGLGRRWVMSPEGRADAAERWYDGECGPESAMARSTKRVCRDCGFYLPLAGSLGTVLGVCGNAMSADGRVVASEYGCGAHSDTPAPAAIGSPAYDPYDDGLLDVAQAPAPEVPAVTAGANRAEAPEAAETADEADSAANAGGDPEQPEARTGQDEPTPPA